MASSTLHAMLWPRMPAGERIADWVTWNLFLFWRLPLVAARPHRSCPTRGVVLRLT
jgi:hypothetical protein